jgi:prolyl-tRNA synthetase
MKDLYSFSKTQEEHDAFYSKAEEAYSNVYSRVGLGKITYKTFALGGTFSKYSHEYQTISDAGEDIIYIDEAKNIAINKEAMLPEVFAELGVESEKLVVAINILLSKYAISPIFLNKPSDK